MIISMVGFVINVPVSFLWRETYQKTWKEDIIEEMRVAEMQKIQAAKEVSEDSDLEFILDVIPKKQSFGNSDRVTTDSLEIQTSPEYSTTIKDVIVRLSRKSKIRGKFVAAGIIRAIGSSKLPKPADEKTSF
jgi:hypothetical protein